MTTDEAESQQKKPQQQQEEGGGATEEPEHEQLLRGRHRHSAGRGLSRLFNSFLKRRSQCDPPDQDSQAAQEEEEAKAPIADPEPELRAEGEQPPVAPDQHSADLEGKKEGEEQAEVKVKESDPGEGQKGEGEETKEGEKEGEAETKEDGTAEEKDTEEKSPEEDGKAPKAPRKPRNLEIKITLLDDTTYELELEKHAKGQDLFDKVCDHLNLLEKDYYGLAIWDTPTVMTWLDMTKEIRRQVRGGNYSFTFNVKFYPPDPAQLSEDITRSGAMLHP